MTYRNDDLSILKNQLERAQEENEELNSLCDSLSQKIETLEKQNERLEKKIDNQSVSVASYRSGWRKTFAFSSGIGIFVIGMIVLFATALKDCNSKQIQSGRVVGREFDAAHSTTTMSCVSTKSGMHCTPHTNYYPDVWTFRIRQGTENRNIEVDEESYNNVEDGQWVCTENSTIEECSMGTNANIRIVGNVGVIQE